MKLNKLLLTFLLTITTIAMSDVDCKGGGDNGTPFIEMSEFQANAKIVKTPGLIKDFMVREGKQEIVFREEDNTVWKAAGQSMRPLQKMFSPFSRVIDPWSSFIVAKNSSMALNTNNNYYYYLGNKQRRGEDLYWNESRVFTLENADYAKQTIKYSIHNLSGSTQNLSCILNFGEKVEMHIGNSGHTFPYLFIYTTMELPEGTKVAKYALRLEAKKKIVGEIPRCELTSLGVYKNLMPGKVNALYHFGDLEDVDNSAWLMDIANPKKRILWSYREQCTYFKAPLGRILIPNPQIPVVALQKQEGGIKLIYPWIEKSADILEKIITRPLVSDNLWLTGDRKNLYVAAQPENENARLLFKVALDQVQ